MRINLAYLQNRPIFLRVGGFIFVLLLMWLPVAAPIYLLLWFPAIAPFVTIKLDSNTVSIVTMVVLYAEFLFLLRLWSQQIYQRTDTFKYYGLEISRQNVVETVQGLAIGLSSVLILFGLQGFFGWLRWQQSPIFFTQIALEGLAVGLGVGFAEELFFRGWLLEELHHEYTPSTALWADAVIFASLHFIKPLEAILQTLPQFPALLLLGLTQVWGKRWRRGRLGLPIGLHGGLVWGYYMINVGQLTKYTGVVPDWVTGIHHNPLMGVMGVGFMGILAWGMRLRGKGKEFLSSQ
ncbi:CPBP family intramembrane glutamic endopeptidase [Calothrix sp. 336/3]|uniref:CPBP family intramembrane glutamic endopeptidase n=1 Tax=Calothrix sp. 336/3 TaxID=1337936 RepID=UPI0004E3AF14|nr:type II CAAX endopeptidase family protein [Calothrix sp. 336/3]AKG23104.1 abortive phage infection protein [Calothrix sp. 336/3]